MLTVTPIILTEVFSGFPQFLQESARIVPQLGHNAPNNIQLTIHQSSHYSHNHNHGHGHYLLLQGSLFFQPVPSQRPSSPLVVVTVGQTGSVGLACNS
jgi:hypothetical protein